MTRKDIVAWIMNHQRAEFNADGTATYYIHVTADGDLTADAERAATTFTETVSIEKWASDNSPEKFYEEFETEENPAFCEMVDRFTARIGGAE